jgi:hypothetical protein
MTAVQNSIKTVKCQHQMTYMTKSSNDKLLTYLTRA